MRGMGKHSRLARAVFLVLILAIACSDPPTEQLTTIDEATAAPESTPTPLATTAPVVAPTTVPEPTAELPATPEPTTEPTEVVEPTVDPEDDPEPTVDPEDAPASTDDEPSEAPTAEPTNEASESNGGESATQAPPATSAAPARPTRTAVPTATATPPPEPTDVPINFELYEPTVTPEVGDEVVGDDPTNPCPDFTVADVRLDPEGDWDGDRVENNDEFFLRATNPCEVNAFERPTAQPTAIRLYEPTPRPAAGEVVISARRNNPCPSFTVADVIENPTADWDRDRVNNHDEFYGNTNPCVVDSFRSCDDLGIDNVRETDAAYRPHLDADDDGIACENLATATTSS